MKYAPIVIPTLCRSTHFIRLIESLKRNGWAKYTDVYVGLDYPPSDKYVKGWREICDYVDHGDFSAFASFNVFRRKKNYGPSNNNEDLNNHVLKKHDRYIYCEDDLEVAPNFIEYLDKCLEEYESYPDIVAVSAYSYPIQWNVSEGATCFCQNFCASMWGTGFWKEKNAQLDHFIISGKMLDELPKVIHEKLYEKMLDAALCEYIPSAVSPVRFQHKGLQRSTDIAVRASLVVDGKYIVSPVISKVRNHGFDGSGFYCQDINEESVDNQTAGTYMYSQQPIDNSNCYELHLDETFDIDDNRQRLNIFDCRSEKQMKQTHILLWIMTHLGIWAARWYYMLFCFPRFIFAKIVQELK